MRSSRTMTHFVNDNRGRCNCNSNCLQTLQSYFHQSTRHQRLTRRSVRNVCKWGRIQQTQLMCGFHNNNYAARTPLSRRSTTTCRAPELVPGRRFRAAACHAACLWTCPSRACGIRSAHLMVAGAAPAAADAPHGCVAAGWVAAGATPAALAG